MANAPEPITTELTEPFYAATAEGKLLIQRCKSTGKPQWYPRSHSVHDINAEVEWVEVSGEGEVYSYSVVSRSPFDDVEAPYVFALVDLAEGVRLAADIVDVDPETVEIGMAVKVVFQARGEHQLPVFTAR